MKELATGLWQLSGFPPNGFNVYLAGDVLIDAATRRAGRRILRQLAGRAVTAHALTHAHPDHQGASKEVCEKLGMPFWCGEADVRAAESGDMTSAQNGGRRLRLSESAFGGPGHPVDRALREGDEVAGFQVLDTPGHSPGHVSYWRESDRTLICGDVFFGQHLVTGLPGLHPPPDFFTHDPAQNRESMRRLAALEPALVCFGHGPPLRDTKKLVDFVAKLPE